MRAANCDTRAVAADASSAGPCCCCCGCGGGVVGDMDGGSASGSGTTGAARGGGDIVSCSDAVCASTIGHTNGASREHAAATSAVKNTDPREMDCVALKRRL